MFDGLIHNILEEVLKFLSKHKDFFENETEARLHKMESLEAPTRVKMHLSQASGEAFLEELKLTLSGRGNSLLRSILEFLNESFSPAIDAMHELYNAPTAARQKKALELFPDQTQSAKILQGLLLNRSNQELSRELANLSKKISEAPHFLIQTPREVDLALKNEIRSHLAEKYPSSTAAFQINRKLIGGFRIFADGKNMDHSWLSRVLRFTSLKTT